mmetsp:Transcript_23897/g.35089  ORF Transcript_23897/g.35089 Transcript_23897/m.35089 type:complete len:285 (+) Transcript_23897:47-901(+)
MSKHVVVTGGNSGIGLALCKLLATEHGCYVYLGSRSAEKGAAAVKSIVDAAPAAAGKIEMLQVDISDDTSCLTAAATLKAKGVVLYGLVNNAGVGLAHGDVGGADAIMNTNYKGPLRMTEAFVGLIDPNMGRIVHTSSGVASMWLRNQDADTKALYSNPDITQEQLDADLTKQQAAGNLGMGEGYGLSKAALTTLTMIHAKKYPNLMVTSLSPGFIDTPMTKGFGAKLSPEQGCVSSIKCLLGDVSTGCYYGSDGVRSPLTCTRDPGMPEYKGETDPDPKVYNK